MKKNMIFKTLATCVAVTILLNTPIVSHAKMGITRDPSSLLNFGEYTAEDDSTDITIYGRSLVSCTKSGVNILSGRSVNATIDGDSTENLKELKITLNPNGQTALAFEKGTILVDNTGIEDDEALSQNEDTLRQLAEASAGMTGSAEEIESFLVSQLAETVGISGDDIYSLDDEGRMVNSSGRGFNGGSLNLDVHSTQRAYEEFQSDMSRALADDRERAEREARFALDALAEEEQTPEIEPDSSPTTEQPRTLPSTGTGSGGNTSPNPSTTYSPAPASP